MQICSELWKDAPGLEDLFLVSNCGRIFSKRSQKLIKLTELKSGYLTVCTRIGGRNGIAICKRVHRLVAEAFIASEDKSLEVNHIDGNKKNNRVNNLEWVTSSENKFHAYRVGLRKSKSGVFHPSSKFTEEEIEMIRDSELSNSQLATLLSVNRSTIYRCRNGIRYS